MVLVKSVEVDIGVKGAEQSKAKLDEINARAEELKKAFPEYKLKIDSAAAQERLAVFRGQVKAVADEVRKPMDPVVHTDKAKAKLLEIQVRAEELKARFPEFTLRIDDRAAKLKLAALAVEAKAVDDAINSGFGGSRGGILSRLGGLFGGGGGGGGGGGAGGAGGLLTSPPGLAVAGIGAAIAAALAPGAIGLGIGGAAGLGAIGGGLLGAAEGKKTLTADQANIKAITTQLKTAIGQQKKDLSAALKDAEAQYTKDSAFFAPFTAFQASLQGLARTLLTPLRSVMGPLAQIFTQFGKGLTALGPQLTAMFSASLPFIRMFTTLMLQSGKILLPAFTQAMQAMVKSGALQSMSQGLVIIVQGLAGFITALGPGMRASATLFKGAATVISALLRATGLTVAWLANVIEDYFHKARVNLHNLASSFDDFRHRTAVIFDGVRHDIAHIWDMTWQNTIGRAGRGVHDVAAWFDSMRHSIAVVFDGTRRNIATTWDTIWNNTVGRVTRGISDVMGWIRGIAGRITGAIGKAGTVLFGWGKGVIQGLLDGFTSIWKSVVNFFLAVPKAILHALGIHSPPQWAIDAGKNIMHGLGIGIDFAKGVVTKATAAAVGAASGVAPGGGPTSASAGQAQAYAAGRLGAYGWGISQMKPLIMLWNQESGWNRFAYNASSGATGIPQALPYTKMPRAAWLPSQGGQASAGAQIDWGLGYIRGRYGSPAGAWAHEVAFNWYDRGGWLMPGLTLALNTTGMPERVGGGGMVVNNYYYDINVTLPPGSDREQGRRIVAAIRAFEKGSGKGWRTS